MKKFICIFLSCWAFCFCVSAADLDSNELYSFEPVEVSSSLDPMTSSALDYGVSSAVTRDLTSTESAYLEDIRDALVSSYSGAYSGSIYSNINSIQSWISRIGNATVSSSSTASTLLSNLEDINTWLHSSGISDSLSDLESGLVGTSASVLWYAREIYNDTSNLSDIYLAASNTSRVMEDLLEAVDGTYGSTNDLLGAIWGDTEEINTNAQGLYDYFYQTRGFRFEPINSDGSLGSAFNIISSLGYLNSYSSISLVYDGVVTNTGNPTLYHFVKRLANTLASYDDLALSEAQKANREEIEGSFLTGSSGSTSLGASDFGDLADVGGTIKDSLSLDGNATIGSFTSGLAAADSAGQGWFSEATRAELDAVSSVSTYSLRGDPDPYNMAGWEDRYYWLLGDDE